MPPKKSGQPRISFSRGQVVLFQGRGLFVVLREYPAAPGETLRYDLGALEGQGDVYLQEAWRMATVLRPTEKHQELAKARMI